jgi:hypothetical protein
MMIFRSSSVDGKPNDAEMDLPEPDPEVVAELFSASAIARYGQWTSEVPSAHDAEIKDRAQRRWIDVAKQGRTEVSFGLSPCSSSWLIGSCERSERMFLSSGIPMTSSGVICSLSSMKPCYTHSSATA